MDPEKKPAGEKAPQGETAGAGKAEPKAELSVGIKLSLYIIMAGPLLSARWRALTAMLLFGSLVISVEGECTEIADCATVPVSVGLACLFPVTSLPPVWGEPLTYRAAEAIHVGQSP